MVWKNILKDRVSYLKKDINKFKEVKNSEYCKCGSKLKYNCKFKGIYYYEEWMSCKKCGYKYLVETKMDIELYQQATKELELYYKEKAVDVYEKI